MYWDHMTGWGWTMMVFWSVVWVGLLGVVIWAAAQWARGGSPGSSPQQPPQPSKTARELLDERLARGEIDLDEYQRLRDAIEHRPLARV
jgi:putative membrane protein